MPIRLTDERWDHIVNNHRALQDRRRDVLDTVETPEFVLEGYAGELLAVRRWARVWIVVPYREANDEDGFIITAYLSRVAPPALTIVWPST